MVRFKNRYIVIEVKPREDPSDKSLKVQSHALSSAILEKVEELHGDFGVAAIRAGFVAKYCNEHTRVACIRVRHGPHRLVSSSLPFISRLGYHEISLHILYVGATLKHCFKFLQKYQRQQLDRMWSTCQTETERNELEQAVMTLHTWLTEKFE